METDYAGNATYTFTLRESACWSDGRAVTAADFVAAWQRLANPANALPHRELLSAISGYAAVQETGEIDNLAVSAPDARTLTVTLAGSPAWFLADVCAGAYTMPVREDLRGSWDKGTVTNGPYTAAEFTSRLVRLERSVTYYDATGVGPEELCFQAAGDPMADYDRLTAGELDLVFSFEHMECDQYYLKWFKRKFRPKVFFDCLIKWQEALDWNALYLENHDQPRSIPRFGSEAYWKESGKLLAALLLTLRGTPFIYQGEEIGMVNFDFDRMRQLNDVESKNVDRVLRKFHIPQKLRWKLIKGTSRDNARTPFQWDEGPGAGFTEVRPWLGVNHNYEQINLSRQEKDEDSIWWWYKRLSRLRRDSPALRRGSFKALEATEQVFSYVRETEGQRLAVVLNFSDKPAATAQRGQIVMSNINREKFDGSLAPWEAVILSPQ